jgi:guanylate cyclase
MSLWTFLVTLIAGLMFLTAVTTGDIRVGIQTNEDPSLPSASDYNGTFSGRVQAAVGETVHTMVLSDVDLFAGVADASLDFVLVGATSHSCLAYRYGISPLVSVVRMVAGQATPAVAGAIVTASDRTDILAIQDLSGKRIGCSGLDQLTGCQSQWAEMVDAGLSLFQAASQVLFANDSLTVLRCAKSGILDVAFVQAGQLEALATDGVLKLADYKLVAGRALADFPYETSTRLYPAQVLSAVAGVSTEMRSQVAQALLAITSNDSAAVDGNYSQFTAPYDYTQIQTLQREIGFLFPNNTCHTVNTVNDIVSCPPGFSRAVEDACSSRGLTCPAPLTCVCNPCVKDLPPVDNNVSPAIYLSAVLGGLAMAYVAVRALCKVLDPSRVTVIDFDLLCIDATSPKFIGRSGLGRVVRAKYQGLHVVVKRAFPKTGRKPSIFDGENEAVESDGSWFASTCESIRRLFSRSTIQARIAAVWEASHMRHNNLVEIIGVSVGAHGDEILIVNRYMEKGTLNDLVHNTIVDMGQDLVLSILKDVACGLLFLHSRGIVGKNLRSHHLLLDSNYRCRIGTSLHPMDRNSRAAVWLAPEVLQGGPRTCASDVYAFAFLMYEVLYRAEPFEGESTSVVLEEVMDTDADLAKRPFLGTKRRSLLVSTPESPVQALMISCWATHPHDRPDMDTVYSLLQQTAPDDSCSLAERLMREQALNKDLINRLFPPFSEVREALTSKNSRTAPIREHAAVTVYYSDIVGFTELSSNMDARRVAEMLHALYKGLDDLIGQHGLFKVETVGDAFFCCGNLLGDTPDHVQRVAEYAIAAIRHAKTCHIEGRKNQQILLRVGMHTGSVVSSIMGSMMANPRYTLLGEAVTVAMRMEKTAEPGKIQCSEEVASVLQKSHLSSRVKRRPGRVDVIGQGSNKTYWIATDDDMIVEHQQQQRLSAVMASSVSDSNLAKK